MERSMIRMINMTSMTNMTNMIATMKIGDVIMIMIVVNVPINGLIKVMQQFITTLAISLCARNALRISDLHNEDVVCNFYQKMNILYYKDLCIYIPQI